jgi:hypothetical protein
MLRQFDCRGVGPFALNSVGSSRGQWPLEKTACQGIARRAIMESRAPKSINDFRPPPFKEGRKGS